MAALTRSQLVLLVALTLTWGINWPVMKVGVTGYPPLTFRTLSILMGLPVLALALRALKVPMTIPRQHWPELFRLSVFNMFFWHACIILAVQQLSSGRSAILGYTMPIFAALAGMALYGQRLNGRGWLGVGAAGLGVVLLLWHEFTGLAGNPAAVGLALLAAAAWGLGTQMLRRTAIPLPTLTLSLWMTVLTAGVMAILATVFEMDRWRMPSGPVAGAMAYNALIIFGFAHAAWFSLARDLPPTASTLSVMFIPVLGVFSGAWWLDEVLHWQDWAAVALMVVAIASVLWPSRR
jgi:drug/metabolite transporter (DMT)-like permease